MTQAIVATLRELQLSNILPGEEPNDRILDECRPLKRARKTEDEVKKELENEFLTPPTVFGTDWLNKLQQYVIT